MPSMNRRHRNQLLVVYSNKDVVAVDFNFVGNRVLSRRHANGFSGSDIEFCPMTWTLDFATFVSSIAQRSAVMRADVVDTKEIITDAKQNYQSVVGFDERFRTIGKIPSFGDFDKFTHEIQTPAETNVWLKHQPNQVPQPIRFPWQLPVETFGDKIP
jgi:hypothetical protein